MHTVPKHLYDSCAGAAYILAVIAEHNKVSINTRYSFTKKQWMVWVDKNHKASGKTLWDAAEAFIIHYISINPNVETTHPQAVQGREDKQQTIPGGDIPSNGTVLPPG